MHKFMRNHLFYHKHTLVYFLLIINSIFTFGMSYAYWASSININNDQADGAINIGEWYDAIPIYNVDEFIEMITTDLNTNNYVLVNNLDFENITPISWTQTKNIRFMGSFNGRNLTISNITLLDYPGVFGILDGATIKNLTINFVDINYTTSDGIPSGILASRVQGINNVIENITINDSLISSAQTYSGSLIGQTTNTLGNGSAYFKDINITNTIVSGGISSTLYGNGGLIGSVENSNVIIENINLNVDVTSISSASSGGLLGSVVGTSSLNIDNVSIDQSNVLISGTGNTIGSAGLIGLLQSTQHEISNISITNSNINSNSLSGGVIGYANGTSGTLNLTNIEVVDSVIISSNSGSTRGVGGVIALLIGYELSMQNVFITSLITSVNATNAGGIIGFSNQTSVLSFDNITIDQTVITIMVNDNSIGAAGVVGLLHGSGHTMSNIHIINSEITSSSLSGGVIGYANQASGTLQLSDIYVSNSIINSSNIGTTRGTGGIISVVNGFNITMTDINLSNLEVTSMDSSHAGGAISYVSSTGTIHIDGMNITEVLVTIEGTGNSLGAGGVIGRIQGSGHELKNINLNQNVIMSASLSGGIIGYAVQNTGVLDMSNISVNQTSVTSLNVGNTRGSGGMIGLVQGYELNISNSFVSVNVQSANASSAGAVIAHANSASKLTLNNVLIEDSIINIDGIGTSLGAGGAIGVLYGTDHVFTNISVHNVSITSQSSSGGLIGFLSQTDATMTLNNFEVINSTISTSIANASYGAGGVVGTVNGYTLNIDEAFIQANIYSIDNSNVGGIVGMNRSNTSLIFDNITIDQSNIKIDGAGTTLGSGGLVGRLSGLNHAFTNIRVSNSQIESNSSSGGLIGYASQSGGVSLIENIKVKDTNIYTSANNATLGAGGLIGFNQSYTYEINDVYIETLISSENTNVGGIIGYSRYLNGNFSRIVINAQIIIDSPLNTDRGAAGFIGRNRDGQTAILTDLFFTGYLKSFAPSDEPYAGIVRANNLDLTVINVRSAEISYFTTSNPIVIVDSILLYTALRGQNPDYLTTYTVSISAIDETYWSTNFSNITSSSLWDYNMATHLYEISS